VQVLTKLQYLICLPPFVTPARPLNYNSSYRITTLKVVVFSVFRSTATSLSSSRGIVLSLLTLFHAGICLELMDVGRNGLFKCFPVTAYVVLCMRPCWMQNKHKWKNICCTCRLEVMQYLRTDWFSFHRLFVFFEKRLMESAEHCCHHLCVQVSLWSSCHTEQKHTA